MKKLAVIAIGGNSLIRDGQVGTIPEQLKNARITNSHVARILEQGWEVVITHGNGPQVGFILLRSELTRDILHGLPLDVCGAHSQGGIGYLIQQTLASELQKLKIPRSAATVITQTLVDKEDPAFRNPTKPIGPFLTKEKAERYSREEGWRVIEDAGRGYRRVVPSPKPKRIVELDVIKEMLQKGLVVIAVGGGGIPVIEEKGELVGVEAVIDKDLASSLLATELDADLLLISTSIDKVYLDFGKPSQRAVDRIDVRTAERYLAEGHFLKGSMAPKIEAALNFVKKKGKEVIVTSPDFLVNALAGGAGTRIVPNSN